MLGPDRSTLRRPASPDWISLDESPGRLRLRGDRALGFTGAFVGLRAWDLTGRQLVAGFGDTHYRTH
ncbi:hypothetical protein [Kitasatospora sp. NPDC051914]|uniref:hypothetical protein n=1 Tax=Kitasatospora sp. NPDC051914 TaxID=3154945 RepID=UPI00341C2683